MHIDHFKEHFQTITDLRQIPKVTYCLFEVLLARYVRLLLVRKVGLISVNTFSVIIIGLSAMACFYIVFLLMTRLLE